MCWGGLLKRGHDPPLPVLELHADLNAAESRIRRVANDETCPNPHFTASFAAWDLGVALMDLGEKALLYTDHTYAYGNLGLYVSQWISASSRESSMRSPTFVTLPIFMLFLRVWSSSGVRAYERKATLHATSPPAAHSRLVHFTAPSESLSRSRPRRA